MCSRMKNSASEQHKIDYRVKKKESGGKKLIENHDIRPGTTEEIFYLKILPKKYSKSRTKDQVSYVGQFSKSRNKDLDTSVFIFQKKKTPNHLILSGMSVTSLRVMLRVMKVCRA